MFQNPALQSLFPDDQMTMLNNMCVALLKEVKEANPLKWVTNVTSASNEVDEFQYWREHMRSDADVMITQIQSQLYTGIDELFGENEK